MAWPIGGNRPTDPATPSDPARPADPAAALAELLAGNRRFVSGDRIHPNQDADRRAALLAGQDPFAVVFGCSDSRLAAEIIFDRGLGDLFLVRTAGHVIGDEVLGSIEYAVTVLGTPLVVVLGHDLCGAVQVTHQAIETGTAPTGHLTVIVEGIAPSVYAARVEGVHDVNGIVEVHIRCTANLLLSRSETLAAAVGRGECDVVGLAYDLADGQVRVVATDAP